MRKITKLLVVFVLLLGVGSITTKAQNQTATKPLTITIATSVAPTLTKLTPAHVITGAPPSTLALTGTGFVSGAQAWLDTQTPATTFVSSTQLTMVMPTVNIAGTSVVKVVNPDGKATGTLNLTKVAPLTINPITMPAGTVGVSYTATFVASGGTPPYSWSIVSGTLPAGLSLGTTTGVISGIPTAVGSTTFTVQCVDSTGALARRTIR